MRHRLLSGSSVVAELSSAPSPLSSEQRMMSKQKERGSPAAAPSGLSGAPRPVHPDQAV